METETGQDWVAGRLAETAPAWEPDVTRARMRLTARMDGGRRGRWTAALAVAGALAVAAAVPQCRVMAQELWHRWWVSGFAAERLDLSRVPLEMSITMGDLRRGAAGADEAAAQAGYRPVLPGAGAGVGEPVRWAVSGSIGIRQTIEIARLREALRHAGAGEIEVPDGWQGATLHMTIAPMISAEYADGSEITQSTPIRLEAPADLPLAAVAEAAFRCAGATAERARELGAQFAAQPVWMLDLPAGGEAAVETVALPAGRGLLVEEPGERPQSRFTLLFGTAGRVFAISAGSREQCLRLASALP